MSQQRFYELSVKSMDSWKQLTYACKDIMGFWLLRFSGIVNNSDRGLDCPYALQAMRHSREDGEIKKFIGLLKKMRATIDDLLEQLES